MAALTRRVRTVVSFAYFEDPRELSQDSLEETLYHTGIVAVAMFVPYILALVGAAVVAAHTQPLPQPVIQAASGLSDAARVAILATIYAALIKLCYGVWYHDQNPAGDSSAA